MVDLVEGASRYLDYEFGPDGNLYVAAVPDIGVLKFDGQTFELIELLIPLSYVSALTFGSNGNLAVLAGDQNNVFSIREFAGDDGRLVKVLFQATEPLESRDEVHGNFFAYRP